MPWIFKENSYYAWNGGKWVISGHFGPNYLVKTGIQIAVK